MLIYTLLTMIFLHIVDDFYLQGILANLKQKKWWSDNCADVSLYKNDYLAALLIHSFSWAFLIQLPFFKSADEIVFAFLLAANVAVHAIVDNCKANKLKINLITDQTIHLGQIIITWLVLEAIK